MDVEIPAELEIRGSNHFLRQTATGWPGVTHVAQQPGALTEAAPNAGEVGPITNNLRGLNP